MPISKLFVIYSMVNIGEPAPNFSGNGVLTGQDWSLSDHQGKVILIAFNAYLGAVHVDLKFQLSRNFGMSYKDVSTLNLF